MPSLQHLQTSEVTFVSVLIEIQWYTGHYSPVPAIAHTPQI